MRIARSETIPAGDLPQRGVEVAGGRGADVSDLTQTVWLQTMVMNTSMGPWRAVRMTTLSCPLWNQWHLFCHDRDSPSWIRDVDDIFSRVSVMKTVPRFLWGFRIALKVAIEEILNGGGQAKRGSARERMETLLASAQDDVAQVPQRRIDWAREVGFTI